jgi:hypothetical protein
MQLVDVVVSAAIDDVLAFSLLIGITKRIASLNSTASRVIDLV